MRFAAQLVALSALAVFASAMLTCPVSVVRTVSVPCALTAAAGWAYVFIVDHRGQS